MKKNHNHSNWLWFEVVFPLRRIGEDLNKPALQPDFSPVVNLTGLDTFYW